jgi:hypothetical protein
MEGKIRMRKLWLVLTGALAISLVALAGPAAARDRNHDRIPDRWEKHHHLSLHKKQTRRNQDHDGLLNRREWKAGMDPRDPDSDEDGVEDGDEGAGTIASFEGGVLTINLFHGSSVSGLVTGDTEIECDNGDDHGDEDADGEGGRHGDTGDADDHGDDDPVEDNNQVEDDDQGDDGEGEDDEHECSVDDLTVDRVVQEAELELANGDAVFEEIELLG